MKTVGENIDENQIEILSIENSISKFVYKLYDFYREILTTL